MVERDVAETLWLDIPRGEGPGEAPDQESAAELAAALAQDSDAWEPNENPARIVGEPSACLIDSGEAPEFAPAAAEREPTDAERFAEALAEAVENIRRRALAALARGAFDALPQEGDPGPWISTRALLAGALEQEAANWQGGSSRAGRAIAKRAANLRLLEFTS